MKRFLLLFLVVALAAPAAFAQRSTAPASFALTINVNVGGAAIFVDNVQIKGNVVSLPGGNHTVRVSAPGYLDFSTTVSLSGAMTLPVTLQPATAPLTIKASPPGAAIFVDGAQIKGDTVTVSLGSHSVKVTANGYIDFTTTVGVSGATTVPVTLQPATFALTVQANPATASIFIDGAQVKGGVATVTAGNHSVKVSAPGYLDFATTVAVSSAMTLPVTLQPAMATLSAKLPAANVNTDLKGDHWNQIFIWIDGVKQAGGPTIQVPAGKHLVRVTSGGMQVEITFDFQPGKAYAFEPFMGVNIK